MTIIAHRGFWLKLKEQNTILAFTRALDKGYGIELDVRDFNGKIVISHNPPEKKCKDFYSTLSILSSHKNFKKIIYAINVKSDGIENELVSIINNYGILKNSFVFDMSIPSEFIFYKNYRKKINFAARHSDLEPEPTLYKYANWVWIDELAKSWINNTAIVRHINNNKQVCLVSPELHNRNHIKKWKKYLSLSESILKKIYLCTDFPDAADNFFNRRK